VTPGEQMIFYYENELRAMGFSDREAEEASALRRQVWNYLATGLGYDQAKTAIQRAKGKRWYASLSAQRDHLIASFEHAETARSEDWYKTEMNYDPVAALRKLKVPGLFLFGSDDQVVPVSTSVEIIRRTLSANGRSDFTIKIFPGADHGMHVRDATGSVRLAPGYEETMKDWVLERVRGAGLDEAAPVTAH
jgi:pimeloyl-ACP methyl ester carboxylesterase